MIAKHHVIWQLTAATLGITLGVAVLIFLFIWSPQDFRWFPRCPFLVLTGYKCPGCGSLRAVHSLLHFRFVDAVNLNPFMILAIPLIVILKVSKRLQFSAAMGKIILALTIAWWIFRNVKF